MRLLFRLIILEKRIIFVLRVVSIVVSALLVVLNRAYVLLRAFYFPKSLSVFERRILFLICKKLVQSLHVGSYVLILRNTTMNDNIHVIPERSISTSVTKSLHGN